MSSLVSLNTSFGILPADRGIKTDGMYQFVRHPIYSSYILFFLGYYINNPTLHNAIVICIATIFGYVRILFEERYLQNNTAYVAYMKKVKFRLIPYIF